MIKKKVKSSAVKLPSNKKFGYFFSAIFLIVATYLLYSANKTVGYVLVILALLSFVTTLINADVLLPFNKLWMRLGLLLGKIISPIVLGIIFHSLSLAGVIAEVVHQDVCFPLNFLFFGIGTLAGQVSFYKKHLS